MFEYLIMQTYFHFFTFEGPFPSSNAHLNLNFKNINFTR